MAKQTKSKYADHTEAQLHAEARKQRKLYEDAQAELIDIKRELNKIWADIPDRHKRKRGASSTAKPKPKPKARPKAKAKAKAKPKPT